MVPGKQTRIAVAAIALFVVLSISTGSALGAKRPSFAPRGAPIQPAFDWGARDYALRDCDADPRPKLRIKGRKGWRSAVDGRKMRPGSYSVPIKAGAGESIVVTFKKAKRKGSHRYHLRCLPGDFPAYEFDRTRGGGPRMFSMQLGHHYGAIFDGNGAPVWWVRATGEPDNIGVLPDGTLTWAPVDEIALQVGDIEVRSLRDKLLHKFPGARGTTADVHDLLLLPNGNYMIGAQFTYRDDTSAYGGSADSRVRGIQIQEFSPNGREVWSWSSRGHIDLGETGRWWGLSNLENEPYDVVHWNAVENDGRYILVSMRHTDAVYKISKKTGEVVWKLGGTPTPESLEVKGDPHGAYPLGGQHDVRLQPDGTVTIHDNRTQLDQPPRAVRYKINEDKGRAKLVESVADRRVEGSICCGSARRLDGGDWLVGWGGNGVTSAYDELGRRIFQLTLDEGFSYRSNPVPKGAVKRKQLRKAMDAMAGDAA